MVDIPGLNQVALVTAEAPQDRVSGGDVQRAASGKLQVDQAQERVAQGLGELGQGLNDVSVPLAKQAAAQDLEQQRVTLNPDGSPNVVTPHTSLLFGQAGDAYEHAMMAGTVAKYGNVIQQHTAELHQQFALDAPGFRRAATAWKDTLTADVTGPLKQAIGEDADRAITGHYDSIVDAKGAFDINDAKGNILASIDAQKNQLIGLARQSGVDSPAFRDAKTKLDAAYDALGSNPRFGVPPDRIALEKSQTTTLLQGEATDAAVDRTYNRQGRAAAQKQLEEAIWNNPSLSETDRNRLYHQGLAHLEYLSTGQKAEIAANKTATEAMENGLFKGVVRPEDPSVDMFLRQSQAVGDTEAVQRITAARAAAQHTRPLGGLNDQQTQAAVGLTGSERTAAATYNYNAAVAAHESRGQAGIVNPNGGAAGLYQFMPATWQGLMRSHPELGLTPGGATDPVQAERAQNAFTADNRAALQRAGIEPTDKNTFMAAFLGAAGATKFIKAAQADPNQEAAALFPAEAAQNRADFYDKGERPRTLGEVYAHMTSTFGGTASVAPASYAKGNPGKPWFSQEQLAANPYLMSAYVHTLASDPEQRVSTGRQLGEAAVNALKSDITPAATDIAHFQQLRAQYPDKLADLGDKLDGLLSADNLSRVMGGGQAAAYSAEVMRQAQGADIHTASTAAAFKEQMDHRAANLAEHPLDEAQRRGWTPAPAPLDPQQPQTWAPAIMQRGVIAGKIGSFTGDPAQSVFDKGADLPMVKDVIANGTADQKLALLGPLAQLPDPVRNATFQQLGADRESQVFAAAGSVQRFDPPAAAAILQGQALLKQEPRLAPKSEDREAMSIETLPPSDFGANVRGAVIAGAEAYYAKLSADAGDTSQNRNDRRWQQAIDKVTGGVVEYKGSRVIVPSYGMSESDFRSVLSGLTDADLAGTRLSNGQPLTAAALQPSMWSSNGFRLKSLGDGTYNIVSGSPDVPVPVRADITEANDRSAPWRSPNGLFILDLNGRKPAAATGPSAGSGSVPGSFAPNPMVGLPPAPDLSPLTGP